jgi:hypothetical protein
MVDLSYRSRHVRKIEQHDHQPQIKAGDADQLFSSQLFSIRVNGRSSAAFK